MVKKHMKGSDGLYHINGKTYQLLKGSRAQVWHGTAYETKGELKNTKPLPNPKYAYSNLTTNIIFNYIMHRVGDDFDKFITHLYQNKVKIKYPVYLFQIL